MTALRLLRPVLLVIAGAALLGLVLRVHDGATPAAALGPLAWQLGLVNLVLVGYIAGLTWLLAGYVPTNLRGQQRTGRFGALFVGVTLTLLLLVSAGNLVTLAAAWTVSGALLGRLVAHAGTTAAEDAARRVQRVMASSSALLWAAALTAAASGLRLDGSDPATALASWQASVVAVLVVLAGAVRSALVPFHRWLPETAEAPSPVSALLHAGIVNAAGVVAVLQWDLLSQQPGVLLALAIGGLLTVVWCSLEQRVRPDVKGRLAASTSAQMGWMALQTGLGVPAAAVLHLMAHGAWKAWLFLRAGGAVVRARQQSVSEPVARSGGLGLAALALAPAAVVAVVAVLSGWEPARATPVQLLLAGSAVVLGIAVGVESAALHRTGTATRWLVAATGGLAVAAYVLGATVVEHQVSDRADLTHPELPWGLAVAAVGVVVVALLAWAADRLHPGSHHPVATLVSSTSQPPGSRARGRSLSTAPADRQPVGSEATAEAAGLVRDMVTVAARQVGPAWPLRATVAVNPLAGLECLPFDTALSLGERFFGAPLRPSFTWFLDLHAAGHVSDAALLRSMADHHLDELDAGPGGAAGLLDLTRTLADLERSSGPAEDRGGAPTTSAAWRLGHAQVWCARAWHRAEDRTADLRGPWHLWKRSAQHRTYGLVTGLHHGPSFAAALPDDPVRAVVELLERTGHGAEDLFDVLVALLGETPGWTAHAQWRVRRCGSPDPLAELVALQLALLVLSGGSLPGAPADDQIHDQIHDQAHDQAHDRADDPVRHPLLQQVWLDALDRSVQDSVCRPLADRQARATGATSSAAAPGSQSVWCIDVRSERVRRHLEEVGAHETFGFAGFFGIAGRAGAPDGDTFDQCPVIVAPTAEIEVARGPLPAVPAMTRAASRVAARPGLAFAVAEAAGAAAFAAGVLASVVPATWRTVLDRAGRGSGSAVRAAGGRTALRDLADPSRRLTTHELADAAESMLRTIGLTSGFAPVLLVVGHGSTTENNAFASAYDCGACGGNPGLLNASAMADVLNDPSVRVELARRGITIPAATRALAGLHDTTTDQVSIRTTSPEDADHAALVEPALGEAGRRTAAERSTRLPTEGRRPAPRRAGPGEDLTARASDWSEPMPEWGLAGCAGIVVGPRALTRGIDLGGRAFLHSYDRHHDPDGAVLTAILQAPVVVSQWISSQYWFSSVAPTVLGAGDKTTHNVVGDVGVLTGAHGDLRLGLPWQALFERDPGAQPDAGARPQHVPSRHLVVVDADPAVLATAARQSPGVMTLLSNGWMRLVALDHGRAVDMTTVLSCDSGS